MPPGEWDVLAKLARFHRVEGLVARGLNTFPTLDAPPAAVDHLRRHATRIAVGNLAMAAECKAIHQAFESATIDMIFLKGLTVAALAYGTIAAKSAMDIDILVAAPALPAADATLRSLGYRPIVPAGGDAATIERWHQQSKESQWINDERGMVLDLHSRLADNAALIPDIGLQSPRRQVEVSPGIALPTLEPVHLAAYLAVHGASSAWFRLKWIADFAALLVKEHAGPLNELHRAMQALGAARAANQALLLSHLAFAALDGEPDLIDRLLADGSSRRLADLAWRQLAGRAVPAEPTERLSGTAAIHASQFMLSSDRRFLLIEAKRQGGLVLRRLMGLHR